MVSSHFQSASANGSAGNCVFFTFFKASHVPDSVNFRLRPAPLPPNTMNLQKRSAQQALIYSFFRKDNIAYKLQIRSKLSPMLDVEMAKNEP
jgi:hypothetical protein